MSAKPNIKSAPGQCKLRVVETETRDAIVTDVPPAADGQPHNARTIAYMAIGAESWGPLLAAATDLLEAAQAAIAYDKLIRGAANDPQKMSSACTAEGDDLDVLYERWMTLSRAAIAKATS